MRLSTDISAIKGAESAHSAPWATVYNIVKRPMTRLTHQIASGPKRAVGTY